MVKFMILAPFVVTGGFNQTYSIVAFFPAYLRGEIPARPYWLEVMHTGECFALAAVAYLLFRILDALPELASSSVKR